MGYYSLALFDNQFSRIVLQHYILMQMCGCNYIPYITSESSNKPNADQKDEYKRKDKIKNGNNTERRRRINNKHNWKKSTNVDFSYEFTLQDYQCAPPRIKERILYITHIYKDNDEGYYIM